MSDRLQSYINSVNSGVRAWNLAFVYPYGEAYEKAFEIFKQALNDQAEADKRNAELAVFAASVVSGSILTAAMGSTMMVALRRSGLRMISQRNLQATYRKARAVGTHPVTVFALGKLIDEAQSSAKKSAQGVVERNIKLVPHRLTESPGSMRAQLQATLDWQALCATDAAEAIEKDSSLNEAQKDAHFAILKRAPIVVRPSNALNATELWPKIGLSMFMTYVLDLDTLIDVPGRAITGNPAASLGDALARPEKARRIDMLPSDPNYPRPGLPRNQGNYMPTHQRVGIDQAGGEIIKKTNELHQKVFKEPFFINTNFWQRSTSPAELVKAESTLEKLAERTRPTMPNGVFSV
jgi:hypothetical protein